MSQNPSWPLLEYAIAWGAARGASPVQSYWCAVTNRTEGSVSIQRGKTYELDQVQPGQMTVSLRNDDGVFDPSNTSSPWAGYIVPYRLMRLRAQWPPTANLLTADQATAFYASQGAAGAGATLPPNVVPGAYPVAIANSGAVNQYQVSLPASPAAGDVLGVAGWSVTPGAAHALQAVVASSGGATGYLKLSWINAAGSVISTVTSAPTALPSGGVLLTVAGAAPANAAGAIATVSLASGPNSASTLTVNALQVEQAAASTTWTQPGTWYPLFTGYVERWPQKWSSGGNYGVSNLTVVDLFAWWASQGLTYAAILEALLLTPSFLYALDDAAGPALFADATGNTGPMQITSVNAGSVQAAVNPTANSAVGWLPLGVHACVQFANPDTISTIQPTAVLNLGAATGRVGPPTGTAWTRVIGFRNTGTAANAFVLWNPLAPGGLPVGQRGDQILLYIDNYNAPTGHLKLDFIKNGALAGSVMDGGYVADGGWHIATITMNAAGTTCKLYVDGVLQATNTVGSDMRPVLAGGVEYLGGWVQPSVSGSEYGFTGQMAFVGEMPIEATAAQADNLYEAFRYAWGTTGVRSETSGGRYARILGWAGYTGPAAIDTGASLNYGPAVDIAGGTTPTAVLAALQTVVDSESGQHFVSSAGVVTFQSRWDRINATSRLAFGERAGEVPYLDAATDFDPTRLANLVSVGLTYGSGPAAVAADPTSQANYGTVTLQRSVNTVSQTDLTGAAQYLVYQNSQPFQRLEALPVDIGANPGLWPALLPRELGDCVTVNRRPSNAPALTITGFVEHITWTITDQATATWTAQITSQARHQFWQLDSPVYGLLDSTAIVGY